MLQLKPAPSGLNARQMFVDPVVLAHDLGAFNGRISLDYTGPELELAFNFQFLIETLSRFSKPEVRLFIKNSTAPVVLKAKDEEDRLCLLMPIKLAEARPAAPTDGDEG